MFSNTSREGNSNNISADPSAFTGKWQEQNTKCVRGPEHPQTRTKHVVPLGYGMQQNVLGVAGSAAPAGSPPPASHVPDLYCTFEAKIPATP